MVGMSAPVIDASQHLQVIQKLESQPIWFNPAHQILLMAV